MDKQIIEEMAKHIRLKTTYAHPVKLAEELYNIAIPENAVVLTVKQYENIAAPPSLEETDETFSLHIVFDVIRNVERKETAERIYQMADEIATGSQNDGVNILCAIKKEFGL